MKIFPAIDLLNNQVVRLFQGDFQKQEVFGNDPVAFAQEFEKKGAKYLHLVDLDGAKDGVGRYFTTAKKIVESTNLFVEVGGGIRDEATLEQCFQAGIHRAIIGTLPQKNPTLAKKLVEKYGEKIAVGVDARDGKVAVEGWLETTETDALDFCRELVSWGVKTIIFTDISRDGTGQGINLPLYEQLLTIEGVDIVASGGVATITDIQELKRIGIQSVIVGKALYKGDVTIEELIEEGE